MNETHHTTGSESPHPDELDWEGFNDDVQDSEGYALNGPMNMEQEENRIEIDWRAILKEEVRIGIAELRENLYEEFRPKQEQVAQGWWVDKNGVDHVDPPRDEEDVLGPGGLFAGPSYDPLGATVPQAQTVSVTDDGAILPDFGERKVYKTWANNMEIQALQNLVTGKGRTWLERKLAQALIEKLEKEENDVDITPLSPNTPGFIEWEEPGDPRPDADYNEPHEVQ